MVISMEQDYKFKNLITVTNFLLFIGSSAFIAATFKLPLRRGDKVGWVICIFTAIFAYLHFCYMLSEKKNDYSIPVKTTAITSLSLIGEDRQVLKDWSLYGKAGLVIGKNHGEQEVDIDLSFTADAPFISRIQAVLNFSEGNWYIEDAGGKNRLEIIKGATERCFELTELRPVKLERGDMIRMNDTALLLR